MVDLGADGAAGAFNEDLAGVFVGVQAAERDNVSCADACSEN